jgi:cell division protein FtsW (lipid II flippase)
MRYVIIIIILSTFIVGYADYLYFKSFYHYLLYSGLVIMTISTFYINKTLNEILKIFKKWLGS